MTRPTPISRPLIRRPGCRTIALAAAAALVAACSAGPPSGPSPSAIVASATQESIRLTLTLEGPPQSGAVSWASVRIENVGDRPVRWAGGGCGDPGSIDVDLGGVFPAGRSDWPEPLARFKREALGAGNGNGNGSLRIVYTAEARWGTQVLCTADLRIETLDPGAHLGLRAGWDGTYEGLPVPTGPASVTATFPLMDVQDGPNGGSFATHAVAVAVPALIVGDGGAATIAPASLVDIALADPQFAAWVAAGPVEGWINPDIAHIGDTWRVGLFKANANDSSELYQGVVIGTNGQVIGHTSG